MKGGRRQGRQRKRWEDNIREWTGLEFAWSQRAVENRKMERKLVAKSSVVPQRPSRLRDRWWDENWIQSLRWRRQDLELCTEPATGPFDLLKRGQTALNKSVPFLVLLVLVLLHILEMLFRQIKNLTIFYLPAWTATNSLLSNFTSSTAMISYSRHLHLLVCKTNAFHLHNSITTTEQVTVCLS